MGSAVARILIVEDEPLIGMMLEEWLLELGHQPVGPATTNEAALAFIGPKLIDAAILDVNLGRQRSDPVADAIVGLGVPFAFATGGASDSLAARFAGSQTVSKPFDFEAVNQLVAALICQTSSAGHQTLADAAKPIIPLTG
jgi:DNA-binding response OmpR family regulator